MTPPKRRSNRVDPAIRKAKLERRALNHLGALGFLLWWYFGSGVLLILISFVALFQGTEGGTIVFLIYICFGSFFAVGKVLFAKRIKAGFIFAQIYTALSFLSIPVGTIIAFFASSKLKEIKQAYYNACDNKTKVKQASTQTNMDNDYERDQSNPYGAPEN